MDKVNRYIALSRKDVSKGIERKGNLDYLSWAFAWNALVEEYPDSTFYFGEPVTFPDGSIMVKAGVTVRDITHEMQLPVMDHRNKAITTPNARDVSDAQMRCLVKSIAMHGVGIGLYLGDLKHVVDKSTYEKAEQLLTAQDSMGFHEFVHKTLSEQERVDTFNDAPAGRKSAFKQEWRALLKVADSFLEEVAAAIADATSASDVALLQETIAELSSFERTAVWGRLSADQQSFIQSTRK